MLAIVHVYVDFFFRADVKVTTEVNDTDETTPQNATVVCSFGNMDGWKFLSIQNMPLKGKPYVIMNLASNERITIPKELKERLHLNMDVSRSSGTISISFLLECSDLGRYVCKVHNGDYSYQGGQDLKRKLQIIIIKYEENLENIKQ